MSSHRLREIPDLNCLKRRHSPPREFIELAHEQPRKERKTTAGDQDHAHKHEQEEDVILVSADGTLNLKKRVGDDKEFRAAKSAKTTTKDRATTIEEKNRELTKRLASLE